MDTAVNANTARTARERRGPARQARRISNPTRSGETASSAMRSTVWAWLAPRGPLTSRRNDSTAPTGPCTSMKTVPSGRFATVPTTPW